MKKRKKKDKREEEAFKQILEFKKSAERSKDKRAVKIVKQLIQLKKTEELKREKYKKFSKSIKSLSNIERAEKWLRYVANNGESFGDTEALVYLISRGYDCKSEIEEVVKMWYDSVESVIEEAKRGVSALIIDSDTNLGRKTRRIGGIKRKNFKDITNISTFWLRNFWFRRYSQEFSIDATMLRTVEWCKIGGFDEWWERLVKETKMNVLQGGFSPHPGIFWLFNMCRSDLAVELMKDTLTVAFKSVLLSDYRQEFPWRISREYTYKNKRRFGYFDNYLYCGQMVFCNYILKENSNDAIKKNALNLILKSQNIEQGYWTFYEGDKEPSIETTAVNIHALCLEKPRGWERAVEKAKKWLWSVQKKDGYWYEASCPDPVYLTVLVLDAIELADNGNFVTFSKEWIKRNIHTGKGGKVLLLGKDTDEGLERLKVFENILKESNYEPIIIKEQPDKAEESIIQKVIRYASISKFVIIENTTPSGHLYEFPHIVEMEYTTVVLQEEGKGATWMFEGSYEKHNYIKKFTYNFSTLENTMKEAISWAEEYVEKYKKYQKENLFWL